MHLVSPMTINAARLSVANLARDASEHPTTFGGVVAQSVGYVTVVGNRSEAKGRHLTRQRLKGALGSDLKNRGAPAFNSDEGGPF
jgi:hypothetical protein